MALVSVRPLASTTGVAVAAGSKDKANAEQKTTEAESDPDLARAKDLVHLHYSVKMKFGGEGLDHGLSEAREEVKRVMRAGDKGESG